RDKARIWREDLFLEKQQEEYPVKPVKPPLIFKTVSGASETAHEAILMKTIVMTCGKRAKFTPHCCLIKYYLVDVLPVDLPLLIGRHDLANLGVKLNVRSLDTKVDHDERLRSAMLRYCAIIDGMITTNNAEGRGTTYDDVFDKEGKPQEKHVFEVFWERRDTDEVIKNRKLTPYAKDEWKKRWKRLKRSHDYWLQHDVSKVGRLPPEDGEDLDEFCKVIEETRLRDVHEKKTDAKTPAVKRLKWGRMTPDYIPKKEVDKEKVLAFGAHWKQKKLRRCYIYNTLTPVDKYDGLKGENIMHFADEVDDDTDDDARLEVKAVTTQSDDARTEKMTPEQIDNIIEGVQLSELTKAMGDGFVEVLEEVADEIPNVKSKDITELVFEDLFSGLRETPASVEPFRVELSDAKKTISIPFRNIRRDWKTEIYQQLMDLKDRKIIKKSSTSYHCATVIVPKKTAPAHFQRCLNELLHDIIGANQSDGSIGKSRNHKIILKAHNTIWGKRTSRYNCLTRKKFLNGSKKVTKAVGYVDVGKEKDDMFKDAFSREIQKSFWAEKNWSQGHSQVGVKEGGTDIDKHTMKRMIKEISWILACCPTKIQEPLNLWRKDTDSCGFRAAPSSSGFKKSKGKSEYLPPVVLVIREANSRVGNSFRLEPRDLVRGVHLDEVEGVEVDWPCPSSGSCPPGGDTSAPVLPKRGQAANHKCATVASGRGSIAKRGSRTWGGEMCLPMFQVPKPDGTQRPIYDLRQVNSRLVTPRFHLRRDVSPHVPGAKARWNSASNLRPEAGELSARHPEVSLKDIKGVNVMSAGSWKSLGPQKVQYRADVRKRTAYIKCKLCGMSIITMGVQAKQSAYWIVKEYYEGCYLHGSALGHFMSVEDPTLTLVEFEEAAACGKRRYSQRE
ncbi:hypothetical protein ADUPG1_011502, partial [Aduncisulcus paluster]